MQRYYQALYVGEVPDKYIRRQSPKRALFSIDDFLGERCTEVFFTAYYNSARTGQPAA